MPAYNEAEGIGGFLVELNAALGRWDPEFIVVDDASTDGTCAAVREVANAKPVVTVEVHVNAENRGHGPSTLTALRLGLSHDPDAVVAIDGDGQFTGSDVARVVQALFDTDAEIAEGVRTARGDAFYRQATSLATQALVWSRCRTWPEDANTPLRAYRPRVLQALLKDVPENALTPNLIISALSRRQRLTIAIVPVASLPRRGSSAHGSTWESRRASLPSTRFIRFCAQAAAQWIRL
jgi:glycosyltransferase involved in cell wall biosynthesis